MPGTKRIIYILGAGRSGTTLLDIILGNADDIFSAGEINRFTKRNGIPHHARDEAVELFWKQIADKMAADGYNEPAHYYPVCERIEYHSGILKLLFSFKPKIFSVYAKYQQSLFKYIFETSAAQTGKNIIVDSSKYSLRALALSQIFKGGISFIYMQGNPVITVDSFQKEGIEQPSKSRFAANIYLLMVNALAIQVVKILKRRNHKVSIISYDSLLAGPVNELAKIEKDIDVDLSTPKKLISQKMMLSVGYLFDGNRLRLNNEIRLKSVTPVVNDIKGIDQVFYSLHKLSWYKNKK